MKFLLDTHTALWFARKSPKLSKKAYSAIYNFNNDIYISDISLWEIVIKLKIGKLKFDKSIEELIAYFEKEKFSWLSLDKEHILETKNLAFHHKDPFDRILIAQARIENLTVISCDQHFSSYNIELLW